MDAATIIRDFTAKGLQLAPTDHGTISVTPKSRLTDVDRDLLRKNKTELLAELQSMNIMNLMNIDSGIYPAGRILTPLEPKFTDPESMAQTLLKTMRDIGLQVQLTAQNELNIEPAEKLWDTDWELIDELKPHLIALLDRENSTKGKDHDY